MFVEFWSRNSSELHCQDGIHTDAWGICCSQGCKQSSWSGLCMSSLSPLHRLATQHFDERLKHKQIESFWSQPEHTIWVSRHRTLRSQYLYLGGFFFFVCLKAVYNSCNLQSLLQTARFLCTPLLTLTYSFFSGFKKKLSFS